MMSIGKNIDGKYAWQLSGFYKIRDVEDGITWLLLNINSDFYKGDHNPQFKIELIFLNYMIFTFEVYNTNHVEDEEHG